MSRAAIILAVALVGCDACSVFDQNVESHVDVPTTLEALEAWASERGLSADTGMLEREGGGNVACGHSAACAILIPIILADALLPPTTKRGSVTDDDGVVLYAGAFDLRGRLLQARVFVEGSDESVYREIRRLPLEELGEHPIIEVARVTLDDEGNEAARQATPFADQVDLVAMYDAALREESDGDDRADLVVEELQHLGDEGLAAVEARYEGLETIDDEELVDVLHEVCHGHVPGADLMVRVTSDKGGLAPMIKAVLCLERGRVDAEQLSGIVTRIVNASCEGSDAGEAFPAAVSLAQQLPDAVAEQAGECGDEVRRLHLLFHAGQRPSDADLVRVLREDRQAGALVEALPPRIEENRPILIEALDRSPAQLQIARAFNRGTTGSPSGTEMRRALEVYASDEDESDMPNVRHHLLAWLARAEPGALRAQLAPCRSRAAAPHNAAALVYLGEERARFAAALTGLHEDRIYWGQFAGPNDTFNEDTLIGFALSEAGCTRAEVESAARAVRGGDAPTPCAAW